jgi:hypothetical protein
MSQLTPSMPHFGPRPERRSPARLLIVAAGCWSASAFFGWAFYVRYWKWRKCIAESLSSCVTPEGDNLISGGAFWIVPAVLLAILGSIAMARWARSRSGATQR